MIQDLCEDDCYKSHFTCTHACSVPEAPPSNSTVLDNPIQHCGSEFGPPALMTTCVLGVSSQKVSFAIGIAALACWLIPLLSLVRRNLHRDNQEDTKYVKKRLIIKLDIWNRRSLGIALCLITSVICLWDPWALSWLSWPRFRNPYSAQQPHELGCNDIDQIYVGDPIGQGFYAAVLAAKYKDKDIVVKTPNPRMDIFQDGIRQQFVLDSFLKEKKLLRQVQSSPHVVQLLGACKEQLFLERLHMPLKEYMASQNNSLSEMEVTKLWLAIASAIDVLHRYPGHTRLSGVPQPSGLWITMSNLFCSIIL